jgi:hypothetical protein
MTHQPSSLPTWIFFLFIGLLYLGYTQTKTRTVSRLRIAVIPVIMLGLSLNGILNVPNSTGYAVVAWLSGIGLALLLNSAVPHGAGVSAHANRKQFVVPGSLIPLILLMTVFFVKFAIGFLIGSQRVDPGTIGFIIGSSCISGLISGTFLARAVQIFRAGSTTSFMLTAKEAA